MFQPILIWAIVMTLALVPGRILLKEVHLSMAKVSLVRIYQYPLFLYRKCPSFSFTFTMRTARIALYQSHYICLDLSSA
jgi:hypothetical protein